MPFSRTALMRLCMGENTMQTGD